MAKMNGNTNLIFKIIGLVVVLLGSAVAYGVLYGDVGHNTARVEKMEPKLDIHDRKITVLETRQKAIFDGVERIQKKMDITP